MAIAALSACGGGGGGGDGGGSSVDSGPVAGTQGQVKNFTLKSDANENAYAIQVFVPQSYATGTVALPVIYATESDAPYGTNRAPRFDAFKDVMERLGTQAILVGIGGTQRRGTDFLLPASWGRELPALYHQRS